MASLVFAAGFMTYNKFKDQREQKKEKKRLAYESRYNELQREHTHDVEKKKDGDVQSPMLAMSSNNNPFHDGETREEEAGRRDSNESRRSRGDPSSWVDEVVKERQKSGGGVAD